MIDAAVEVIATQVLVLGGGPGGYTAAFRAADLGLQVIIVEQWPALGGTCLNVGCIPSKALLHAAKIIDEAASGKKIGITFPSPEVDIDALRAWKDKLVKKLNGGLKSLAKQRKVKIIVGKGRFTSSTTVEVEQEGGIQQIQFEKAIIATGSRPVEIPKFPNDDPRIIDSTGALAMADIPARLLVIGGGIIGLEMATVYRALGSKVTVAELADGIVQGCDRDIVRPLERLLKRQYKQIFLQTKVTKIEAENICLKVSFEGDKAPESDQFDKVLVAVGRIPNSDRIGIDAVDIALDEGGFIKVDNALQTSQSNIYAVGDIIGQPMLAHKAVYEGKAVAEIIAGKKESVAIGVIPSVAYTDPELAWVGVTEDQAKANGIDYEIGSFPWAASGRSLSMGRNEGITKTIFEKDSQKIIGGAIVGPNAGELISEITLAIDAGLTAQAIEETIHPHPTLSETIAMSTEMFTGSITDLMPK